MFNNYNEDQLLVNALFEGNEYAITEIYYKHGRKLLSIAYNHLRDMPEAEKIVQNILTTLWDQREQLKIESLTEYLLTALKHAILKAIILANKDRKNLH